MTLSNKLVKHYKWAIEASVTLIARVVNQTLEKLFHIIDDQRLHGCSWKLNLEVYKPINAIKKYIYSSADVINSQTAPSIDQPRHALLITYSDMKI